MELNDPSSTFSNYAVAYDALNNDKDYESECEFLEKIFGLYGDGNVRRILDLGCGTGGHAIRLATRGYEVYGVDSSDRMLAIAREKARKSMVRKRTQFAHGNIRDMTPMRTFDAAICMFAVLGYQTSDSGLLATMRSIKRHLKMGGLFIADFWYGPAVLKQQPEKREKEVQIGRDRIIRTATPEINAAKNIIHVNYGIQKKRGNQILDEFGEKHSMRFFFRPEIEDLLDQSGFLLEHFCGFGDLEKKADAETWNVMIIARSAKDGP